MMPATVRSMRRQAVKPMRTLLIAITLLLAFYLPTASELAQAKGSEFSA